MGPKLEDNGRGAWDRELELKGEPLGWPLEAQSHASSKRWGRGRATLVFRAEKGSVQGLSQHHRARGHRAAAVAPPVPVPGSFSLLPPLRGSRSV